MTTAERFRRAHGLLVGVRIDGQAAIADEEVARAVADLARIAEVLAKGAAMGRPGVSRRFAHLERLAARPRFARVQRRIAEQHARRTAAK